MDFPSDLHWTRDFGGATVTIDSLPGQVLRIPRGRFDVANTMEEAKQVLDAEIAAWLQNIGYGASAAPVIATPEVAPPVDLSPPPPAPAAPAADAPTSLGDPAT